MADRVSLAGGKIYAHEAESVSGHGLDIIRVTSLFYKIANSLFSVAIVVNMRLGKSEWRDLYNYKVVPHTH